MEVSHQEKSPAGSLTHSAAQIDEAEDNLTRCLEAYDQKGEEGLQAELSRIHPSPGAQLRREQYTSGPFAGSYYQRLVPKNRDSSTPTPNDSRK